ncbi:hypothetical protein BCR41DRAFT_344953 [Lobosporangium transversale]|uniref:Uncharacterized protein n=1 Tax=Lobosporangium transversale TaxID=64571 RepID=A0A1Y2H3I3_9FUNG|nr:hypothetical protein BCR41DRAFT_344953 [Lobosporangium transversale]ORZ28273.1 hypothetical protein BCR41DRAFT_344953 [Lobosporangium transversale]|eukprot:XP_021885958.1 hypothetical protein BCR41DRAFT_344953 [Lobosporangium transversale]
MLCCIEVALFVMSRCPDAVHCEGVFSQVFQTKDLPPVNPSLSYIGTIERTTTTGSTSVISSSIGAVSFTKTTTTKTTVTCKHGPMECAGNTQQLCFKKYFPDHTIWVPFVVTMNTQNFQRIGEPQYAREIGEKVVKSHYSSSNTYDNEGKKDLLDKVDQCSSGQEGFDLLVESVEHTNHHGVSTSCTVFIDDRKRCVRDGGVWRECPEGSSVADFVRSIREAASHLRLSLTSSRLFRWRVIA